MKVTSEVKYQFEAKAGQAKMFDLIRTTPAQNLLFYGGGRSGKSFGICDIILKRAMNAPGSRHAIVRRTAVSVRDTLFRLTFPKYVELAYPGFLSSDQNCKITKDDMVVELSNGSVIKFFGFDDTNRDRVLGQEFDTIWMNEATEFDYADFTVLRSRLSNMSVTLSGKTVRPMMIVDLNPDLKSHFTYQCWILKNNPARNVPLRDPDNWACLQVNLDKDATHVNSSYLEGLMDGSEADIARMVDGYWRDENESALFRQSIINQHRVRYAPDDLKRIVVAIDPAASSKPNADETGIVVVGQSFDDQFYVLADRSIKGSPMEWAQQAVQAYTDFEADRIIAEKNNGGEMVELTIRSAGANVPITLVHASRGKVLRAEPVSAIYDDGRVHHVGEFEKLEQQMRSFHASFDRNKDGSPDRLDALVWAIT
ncbi:MAG: hypothetical protein EOO38_13635, partial [Cytophagaceae bacterium]